MIRKILCMATLAGCCTLGMSGCAKEDAATPSGERNVTLQLNVETRAVDQTDGTPAAEEAALYSLRVYAFVDGKLAGHSFQEGNLVAPARFLMDLKAYSDTEQTVDFYVVANEGSMSTPGGQMQLTENSTEDDLKRFTFTRLVAGKGLPMFCQERVTVNMAALDPNNPQQAPGHEGHTLIAQHVSFDLTRSVGKLGVFAAKTAGETGVLRVTGLKLLKNGTRRVNYLLPQNDAVLKAVGAKEQDQTLVPSTAEVTSQLALDITPEERRNPANYTPVLEEPFYPFENPWGSSVWSQMGDALGNVLQIDFEFGGVARSGLAYLPPIERNHYYAVCCLMNNSGKITVDYTVADWDDAPAWDDLEFAYPSYSNPIQPLQENESMTQPKVYFNPDEGSTEGTFSCRFQMTAPSGQEWQATLLDASPADFEVKVYLDGVEVSTPVALADKWYTIRVRALKADNVGKVVSLAISYVPTWNPGESELLLINGTASDDIRWPSSGNAPEVIQITQVDPANY